MLGEFSANHYRKEWTISEIGCNKKSYRTILEKAKERQLEGKPSVKLTEDGNSSDKVAGFVGVSRNTLKKSEEIVKAAEQEPEIYLKKHD